MTVSEWMDAGGLVLTSALIVITALYVRYTKKIMAAALKQATASSSQAQAALQQTQISEKALLLARKQYADSRRNLLEPLRSEIQVTLENLDRWISYAQQPGAVDQYVSDVRNFAAPMTLPNVHEAVSLARVALPAVRQQLVDSVYSLQDMDRQIELVRCGTNQAESYEQARRYGLRALHFLRPALASVEQELRMIESQFEKDV